MNNSTRSASIYGLFDLSDPHRRVRYVGQTSKTLSERLADHLRSAHRTGKKREYPVYRDWLSCVPAKDVGILLLDTCDHDRRLEVEDSWIAMLRTSIDDGGFNLLGLKQPAEYVARRMATMSISAPAGSPPRRAQAAAMSRWYASPEGQESCRARVSSPETRAKIANSLRNGPASAESRARVQRTNHTRWHVNRGLVKSDCEFCE